MKEVFLLDSKASKQKNHQCIMLYYLNDDYTPMEFVDYGFRKNF